MRTAALALPQFRSENKVFWRNPQAAFFTFFMPLMFLVIFNTIFGNKKIDVPGGRASISTFNVPAIVGLSIISACYTNVGISVAFSRDQGVLKRVRGTPLPMAAFLFGRIASSTFIAIILVAIVTAIGAIFYGVGPPTQTIPAFILTLIVGAATFSSLGLAISGLVPNAGAAPAVVNAIHPAAPLHLQCLRPSQSCVRLDNRPCLDLPGCAFLPSAPNLV